MSAPRKVMPDFMFGRRRDIEVQPGAELMLAGFLVTRFPKTLVLGEAERKRISTVIDRLIGELLAGRVTEDATIAIWENGKPANSVDLPIPYAVMEQWMAERITMAIRVDPRGSGSMTMVSEDAAMRGEFPRKLVMPI